MVHSLHAKLSTADGLFNTVKRLLILCRVTKVVILLFFGRRVIKGITTFEMMNFYSFRTANDCSVHTVTCSAGTPSITLPNQVPVYFCTLCCRVDR